MIDFEKDQQEVIKKTDNIQSLADQVERLEQLQRSSNDDVRNGIIGIKTSRWFSFKSFNVV